MKASNVLLRVAACQYQLDFLCAWEAYVEKNTRLVEAAVRHGARLLLFPEYAGLELVSVLPAENRESAESEIKGLHALLPQYLAFWQDLARSNGVHIIGGSLPVVLEKPDEPDFPEYRNRVWVFAPSGQMPDPKADEAYLDKRMMTRFESEDWIIRGGEDLPVFETDFGIFGVAICYDSEFPMLVRRLVEAGAEIILVPSCTDSPAGFHRVRLSCRARALENQAYVVQAPLVGSVDWLSAVDVSTGAAGFFAPPDEGFPEDGILAEGKLDEPGWVFADLDLDRIRHVRQHGQVLNHSDWDRSMVSGASVRRIVLSHA